MRRHRKAPSAGPNDSALVPGGLLARLVLAATAALCAAMLFSASASATPVFLQSFTGSATPDGSMTPGRLAVDETSGDMYVIDTAHSVVDKFSAAGAYLSQFSGEDDTAGGAAFALATESDIAVDNSSNPATRGNVYLVTEGGECASLCAVFAWDKNGTFLWEKDLVTKDPCGIAVDPSGGLWTADYYLGVQQRSTTDGAAIGPPVINRGNQNQTCQMDFDSEDHAYVRSWSSGIVDKFVSTGSGTVTGGSATITDVSPGFGSQFKVGQEVSAQGFPEGSAVVAVGPGTLTLSSLATESNAGVAITSYSGFVTGNGAGEVDLAVNRSRDDFYLVFPSTDEVAGMDSEGHALDGSPFSSGVADRSYLGVAANGAAKRLYVTDTTHGTVEIFDISLPPKTLTVTPAGAGSGTVSSSPAGILNCSTAGGTCSAQFDEGSEVILTATPGAGSEVVWGDCPEVFGGQCIVENLNEDTAVTAVFVPITHTLTINKVGTGAVTCDGGACAPSYNEGQVVEVAAAPAPHFKFAGFSGGGCSTSSPCAVTINANTTLTATFAQITHTLGVGVTGSGSGSVTCNGSTCAASYPEGASVTLAASPASGSSFAGWSGGGCSGAANCTFTIGSDTAVTATFTKDPIVTPPVVTPPVTPPETKPPAKPVKCKKGFKRKTVKGKVKCVKAKPQKKKHGKH